MSTILDMNPDGRDREEEALVAGLSRGSSSSIREFMKRSHRPVYAMTARLTLDPDLRHDWCQDVLLHVVREMGAGRFVYQRPGCFWAWFRSRANFQLINLYHKHRRQQDRISTGEVATELVERLPMSEGADPHRLLEAVESRRIMEECLDSLDSTDQRQALYLALFQEQAYQEVAESMGAALNTVRSWIRRARIAMRTCVENRFG
jgi:RNA polymerase sigma-70 factor (ECF subfamily)